MHECALERIKDDLIRRQQAIDALKTVAGVGNRALDKLRQLPSAQPERETGRWIPQEGWDGNECYKCSACGVLWVFTDGTPEENGANFCPECGADMRTKETDYDYERAVDQFEHDILYEPTFNQDDGSM